MGVLDAQASGTDQAYHPSCRTFTRSPPASGGYSNVSEGGIDPYSESSYKRAVSQMHEDMKALIAHGPQFGIDADPIRATYAYRDQIERAFSERSTIPAFHVTHQFNEDAKNLGGVAPSASMFCPDIDPKASPSSDVPVHDSKNCLSQPSRASDIGNASNSSYEGEECQAPDAGPEFPRAQTIQMLADAMRPIRRVFGKKPQLDNLLFDDSSQMAQDNGPRTFHSHVFAPVMIPREATISNGTPMHAPTNEDGTGDDHLPSTCSFHGCSNDSTGHGNFLQHDSSRAPFSAGIDTDSGKVAPVEPPSSTLKSFFDRPPFEVLTIGGPSPALSSSSIVASPLQDDANALLPASVADTDSTDRRGSTHHETPGIVDLLEGSSPKVGDHSAAIGSDPLRAILLTLTLILLRRLELGVLVIVSTLTVLTVALFILVSVLNLIRKMSLCSLILRPALQPAPCMPALLMAFPARA